MTDTSKLTLFMAAIVLLGTVLYPTGVFALTFTPDRYVTQVSPGVPHVEELTLLNETGETISVVLQPVELDTRMAAEGKATFLLDTVGSPLVSWVTVSPDAFVLLSGESRSVAITMTAPDATSGSLLAGIATTFRPVRSDEQGDVDLISVTGPFIFAEVNTEGVTREGYIEQFITRGGSTWYSQLPVSFEVSFANTGTVHLQPSVSLEVRNMFGRLTEQIDSSANPSIVLPQTSRTFLHTWDAKNSEERTSGLIRELVSPLIGPYTVTARVAYDASVTTAQRTIWFFPWRLGVLISLLLVGAAGARRRLRRV